MDFLKELFTEPLSFEAFQKAVEAKGIKLVDLSKGAYVDKDKLDKANTALKTANETIATLTKEAEDLKASGADAEEWKTKYETLTKDVADKEEAAKKEREAQEKAESIANRFASVLGDKKFSHDAIKADYLKKFGEALESKDFESKSDSEIFHELTKDDAAAFVGVQSFKLEGGKNNNILPEERTNTLMRAMGITEKGDNK